MAIFSCIFTAACNTCTSSNFDLPRVGQCDTRLQEPLRPTFNVRQPQYMRYYSPIPQLWCAVASVSVLEWRGVHLVSIQNSIAES
ncbi:hypothetical protein BS17DRAFT_276404 [Gyrodon lividus]|nr:hypothetical protein BS17DRAFT_276404 [Gyrodon lividus]